MRLGRIVPGLYKSKDGRVVVRRVVSVLAGHVGEVCWQAMADGQVLPDEESKQAAVEAAERHLEKIGATQ